MAKFCVHCGEKLNDNDAFCAKCGATVEGTSNTTHTVVVTDPNTKSNGRPLKD